MPTTRPKPILDKLFKKGTLKKFQAGEVIESTDTRQSIWLLKKGIVKRYKITNQGAKSVQNIYVPGQIFSFIHIYNILFDDSLYVGPETYFYEAMIETSLYRLADEQLIDATKKNPIIYRDIITIAAELTTANTLHLENISLHDAYHKVAHALLYYAVKLGKQKDSSVKIPIPFTQQDIADILDLTRETVSASIARLKRNKLIQTKNKQIIVRNLGLLKEIAYS